MGQHVVTKCNCRQRYVMVLKLDKTSFKTLSFFVSLFQAIKYNDGKTAYLALLSNSVHFDIFL